MRSGRNNAALPSAGCCQAAARFLPRCCHVACQTGQPTDLGCMLLERRWSVMGKAEDKRAAIVAAQAAREAGERAARGVSTSARPARKEKPKWAMRRGRPPKSPE